MTSEGSDCFVVGPPPLSLIASKSLSITKGAAALTSKCQGRLLDLIVSDDAYFGQMRQQKGNDFLYIIPRCPTYCCNCCQ